MGDKGIVEVTEESVIRVVVTAKGVPGFSKTPVEMELPPGSTVATVLDMVLAGNGSPRKDTDPGVFRNVIATLNGRYVPVSEVEERALATNDQIAVMPLVVGG